MKVITARCTRCGDEKLCRAWDQFQLCQQCMLLILVEWFHRREELFQ